MWRAPLTALLICLAAAGRGASPVVTEVTVTPLGQGITIEQTSLNRDWRTRDKLLGISVQWGKDDLGGTIHIDRIEATTIQQLIAGNFIDPQDRQNEGPSVARLLSFMLQHSGSYSFGYAVSPTRSDYRVSLEGVIVPKRYVTPRALKEAHELCKNADEASFRPEIYCWWD
jgi:hypothetical protein